ncbi:O-antigen ligase-like membrane protein [Sulfuritortus calidifontis]|uniref:O-antigen ligase-like membrane protein n=1 Tax=Sulfuritortus calidifontis TaxID=1914471 RepID=A0A4R3JXK4_9PROT|nr:O-antigen ligase family protein [Sulfuritortus calidifontis]TCS71934.1 O-antigen ligase-like membrane protein [Sulfuritortus calidifontis]
MLELAEEFWPLLVPFGLAAFVALLVWFGRQPARGLYLAFFTSGILITPELPVVRDKLAATELVFLLTWFALLLHRGHLTNAGPLRREQRLSLYLGAAFILWTLLSFGVNNIAYADTEIFLPSLVETANFAYGYLVFLTTVVLAREWTYWEDCVKWWVAGSAVVILVGVWAVLGNAPEWAYEEFSRRVASTLKNENQVPSFLLPIFVAMVFMAVRKGASLLQQVAMWGLLTGALITAFGSGSRTALLMILLAVAGVVYVAARTTDNRPYRIGAILNVFVALSVGLLVYVSVVLFNYQGDYALGTTPPWQRPVVTLYDWLAGYQELDNTRPEQLAFVMNNIGDHPLLGTGPKVYGSLYAVEEIHNTYAGVLMQTGMVGMLLFSLWLLHMLWYSLRQAGRIADPWRKVMVLALAVGMVTLLLYNMTMFGLRQRTIWLLAGLLVASWSFVPRTSIRQAILQRGPLAHSLSKARTRVTDNHPASYKR